MKTLIGIQVRARSTRLPNKHLEEIGGKSCLQHVWDSAQDASKVKRSGEEVVVSLLVPEDEKLAFVNLGFDPIFYGDGADLLGRYASAAIHYSADRIVRVTGDCPMLPPMLILKCMEQLQTVDYSSNTTERTYPDGYDIQGCSKEALLWFCHNQNGEREHPFVLFDKNQMVREQFTADGFKWGQIINAECINQRKVSLDTREDLECIRRFYDAMRAPKVVSAS